MARCYVCSGGGLHSPVLVDVKNPHKPDLISQHETWAHAAAPLKLSQAQRAFWELLGLYPPPWPQPKAPQMSIHVTAFELRFHSQLSLIITISCQVGLRAAYEGIGISTHVFRYTWAIEGLLFFCNSSDNDGSITIRSVSEWTVACMCMCACRCKLNAVRHMDIIHWCISSMKAWIGFDLWYANVFYMCFKVIILFFPL